MINEIEVLGSNGKWLLFHNAVKDDDLGREVLRALKDWQKVRVNGGKIYSVD